jgi:HSP20 family protein
MAKPLKPEEKETKSISPWRPFGEMGHWEGEMERMFEDFFGRRLRPLWGERWWPAKTPEISIPAVDLYEEKDEIVAKVDLPGLEKEDIEVNISDHLLTVKGEKKREEETREADYYRSERSYGSFTRTVDLPKEVQVDKAQASFKNGVLMVRIPKTEEAKKKETKVKVE